MSEVRSLPAAQRAYLYVVALVAIHMVVLAVANLLRVAAEIALNAASGGFTGLPFVFADFSQPRELYREQASLAIALLVVGAPAWWLSFRASQRDALRDPSARTSTIRSFYLHLVIFVTALLVFGYGQRTLGLLLQGNFVLSLPGLLLEPDWQARAAGAAAMALASAGALALHLRLSLDDRKALVVSGRGAELRQLAFYGLAVVGLLFAAFNVGFTLQGLWERLVADALIPLDRSFFGQFPGGGPSSDDMLRVRLVSQIPPILAGVALWLGAWLPLQRWVAAPVSDGDVERASVIRKLAIYFVVGLAAIVVLVSATFGASAVIRRLLGDPVREQFTSLAHDLSFPVALVIVFATLWIFHRRVLAAEADRETELERAAGIRRGYAFLIAAIGLAMAAIGTAGAIGVLGSQLMGMNTHLNGETAAYLALVIVGAPAWGFHWWQAQRRLDDAERRSQQRRVYLYLATLGGAIGLLVFGSAALYRIVNALLAASFPLATWHDIWHLAVDAAVSGAAFAFHLAAIREDRAVAVTAAPATATPSEFTYLVRVTAADAASARARLAAALPGGMSLDAAGQSASTGAVTGTRDSGPSVVAVGAIGLVGLLVLGAVLFVGPALFFASPPQPQPRVIAEGPPIWIADFSAPSAEYAVRHLDDSAFIDRAPHGLGLHFKAEGAIDVAFDPTFTPPYQAIALVGPPHPGSDVTLVWRVYEEGGRSIAVRLNTGTGYAQLLYLDGSGLTENLGNPVPVRELAAGQPVELAVRVRPPIYLLVVNGAPQTEINETRLAQAADSKMSLRAEATIGSVIVHELRVHRTP